MLMKRKSGSARIWKQLGWRSRGPKRNLATDPLWTRLRRVSFRSNGIAWRPLKRRSLFCWQDCLNLARISKSRLGRAFYSRTTETVAVELLGCQLFAIREGRKVSGRIVETEAYLGEADLASHAAWSRRGRETMQREAGIVYMYRAYGIHMMFNVVAKHDEPYGAVLIRAVEPVAGIETMIERRGVADQRQLASGPGKLSQAFAFGFDNHLVDLVTDASTWIEPGEAPERFWSANESALPSLQNFRYGFLMARVFMFRGAGGV